MIVGVVLVWNLVSISRMIKYLYVHLTILTAKWPYFQQENTNKFGNDSSITVLQSIPEL